MVFSLENVFKAISLHLHVVILSDHDYATGTVVAFGSTANRVCAVTRKVKTTLLVSSLGKFGAIVANLTCFRVQIIQNHCTKASLSKAISSLQCAFHL